MAGVTYLIRMIPFTAFSGRIRSEYIRRFLYYIPYAVLAAMTFPAVFYSTGSTVTAAAGVCVALVLAFLDCPLIAVSASAAAVVFAASFFF